jgi:hypothetical protein
VVRRFRPCSAGRSCRFCCGLVCAGLADAGDGETGTGFCTPSTCGTGGMRSRPQIGLIASDPLHDRRWYTSKPITTIPQPRYGLPLFSDDERSLGVRQSTCGLTQRPRWQLRCAAPRIHARAGARRSRSGVRTALAAPKIKHRGARREASLVVASCKFGADARDWLSGHIRTGNSPIANFNRTKLYFLHVVGGRNV